MRLRASLIGLATLLVAKAAWGQAIDPLEHVKQLWRAKNYTEVLTVARALRQQAGWRCWQLDYLIGTSQCRIAGREARGVSTLEFVLANYRLPNVAIEATRRELTACRSGAAARVTTLDFELLPVLGQAALVAGKAGYQPSPHAEMELTAHAEREIAGGDELRARVFFTGSEADAAESARWRMGTTKSATAPGSAVIVDATCQVAPSAILECLQPYRTAMLSTFNMTAPAGVITAYVTCDQRRVEQLASRLHGIRLPFGTVAYSVYEDLSLVGLGGAHACGTLAHELFHLFVRQNFGDCPAWLEEGIAAELAVAEVTDTHIRFRSSWRDQTLKRYTALRPCIAKLLSTNWADFAAIDDDDIHRVAVTHAMAAVFTRYLRQKRLLLPIYFELRKNGFDPDRGPTPAAAILERLLGMKLPMIDADFAGWLGASE